MAALLPFPLVENSRVQKSTCPATDGSSVGIASPNSSSGDEQPDSPLDTEPLPSQAEPSMLYINEDVYVYIVKMLLERLNGLRSLVRLSMCCRRIRFLSLPFIFSRCAIMGAITYYIAVPPPSIRPYVRHLTLNWAIFARHYLDKHQPGRAMEFGQVLRFMPHVRSLKFTGESRGIPWEALAICLGYPQVKSISFTASVAFIRVPPLPTDVSSTMCILEELSYPTPLLLRSDYVVDPETGRQKVDSPEPVYLSTLVLGMCSTARSLVLPMQTVPLREMATVDWPALQGLTLAGAFLAGTDSSNMSPALLRMPALRRLVITAALPRRSPIVNRCRILGSKAPPRNGLQSLRTLTIAYPDPNDDVFSTPFPELTELSLRDWPRHYDIVTHEYHSMWTSPILSATEALSVLRRLHAPSLVRLELVYTADAADGNLIDLIAHQFPRLRHLELHRYRRSRDETVDFRHIARTLSALKMLVTLRLHLDFQDDPGEYHINNGYDVIKSWRDELSARGWEILDSLLDPCPAFEGVALLFHGEPPSRFVWYTRLRRADRQPVNEIQRDGTWAPLAYRLQRKGNVVR